MSRYTIEVLGDDEDLVANLLEQVAGLVRLGATDTSAMINDGEAIVNMSYSPYIYDDGDYRDEEGNLLHVHDDAVISVLWGKTAKPEEFEPAISIDEWHEKHGHIQPAA